MISKLEIHESGLDNSSDNAVNLKNKHDTLK